MDIHEDAAFDEWMLVEGEQDPDWWLPITCYGLAGLVMLMLVAKALFMLATGA